jgi:predicted transcriptional regulator
MSEPVQIRALASSMRQAIYQVVSNQGEASVREIGHQLGRHPAALYRHVDQLVEVGVLEEVGSESTARRDAKLYSTRFEYLAYEPNDPEMVEALCAYVRSMTKRAGEEVVRSMETGEARAKHCKQGRDTHLGKAFGWIDRETLQEINTHIDEIMRLMERRPRVEDAELISVMISLAPLAVHTARDA